MNQKQLNQLFLQIRQLSETQFDELQTETNSEYFDTMYVIIEKFAQTSIITFVQTLESFNTQLLNQLYQQSLQNNPPNLSNTNCKVTTVFEYLFYYYINNFL